MKPFVFTSVIANYIPKARVLAHSVKRFHPDLPFYLMLSDEIPAWLDLSGEPFDGILTLQDLGIPELRKWVFQHSIVEVSTGVKGFVIQKLLAREDCSGVIYFDPDIAILSPIDRILEALESHSVVLTPHQTEPEQTLDAVIDNEICSLRHGVFNLGFVAVSRKEEGVRFANWWAERLRHFCFADIPAGLFTDQKWVDLAPAFFSDLCILREPVYNVSTWNLSTRHVEGSARQGLRINGQPIVFYHFSGFDSGDQLVMLEKYGAEMPGLFELRSWYLDECEKNEQSKYGRFPWAWGRYSNGEPITADQRQLYRIRLDLQQAFPDPYNTADSGTSYWHWYRANVKNETPSVASPYNEALPDNTVSDYHPAPYRVFLSLAALTTGKADEWLATSLTQTYERKITVLGSAVALGRCRGKNDAAVQWVTTPDDNVENHLTEAMRLAEGTDFAFACASAILPLYWDLRLSWTAERSETAVSVSPLTSDALEIPVHRARESAAALDGVCYRSSQFALPSAASLLADCCYIRPGLAGEAAADTVQFRDFIQVASRFRFEHIVADHTCVVPAGSEPFRYIGNGEATAIGATLVPVRSVPLQALYTTVRSRFKEENSVPRFDGIMMPRHLHIMHSWGGGLEKWVKDYCRTDRKHQNLVLKSVGTWGAFGSELRLYSHIDDDQPLRTYPVSPAIKGTAQSHSSYRAAIASIIDEFGISRIIISSFIGHSLEILGAGVPAIAVCHDFYPVCPAINLVFGKDICTHCDRTDLERCESTNPHNRFFLNVPPPVWMELRESFVEAVLQNDVRLIAPAPSVRDHFRDIVPAIASQFHVIEHGIQRVSGPTLQVSATRTGPMKVLVLGTVAPHKGSLLLKEIIAGAPASIEFHLVGCGSEAAAQFGAMPRVHTVAQYQWEELGDIVRRISPDLGLLPSVFPETYCYTLQEMFDLALPALCTSVGSFADRITDGENGFVEDADAQALLRRLIVLAGNPEAIVRVHRNLLNRESRSLEDMVADYNELFSDFPLSSRSYFTPQRSAAQQSAAGLLQLFWRFADSVFSEAQSVCVPFVETDDRQILRLRIPAVPDLPIELRLDFGSEPRMLAVSGMRIFDHSGSIVWQASLQQFPEWPSADILVMNADSGSVLLSCTGPDPQVRFLQNDPVLVKLFRGGIFEVTFQLASSAHAVPILVENAVRSGHSTLEMDRARALAQSIIAREPHTAAIEQTSPVNLQNELSAAKRRVQELEASLSWRASAPLRVVGRWLLASGVVKQRRS